MKVIEPTVTEAFNKSVFRIPQDFRKFAPIRHTLLDEGFVEHEKKWLLSDDHTTTVFVDKLFLHNEWKHAVIMLTRRKGQEPLTVLIDALNRVFAGNSLGYELVGLYFLRNNDDLIRIF
jgi:hypothetical protein